MPPSAKICGLSTPETLDAAVAAGANQVGLVFFPASPRNVGFDLARGLAARVPSRVGKVGVFVDPDDGLIERAVASGVDTIQLHKVPPARAAAVRARFGLPVWAAVAVRTRGDVEGAAAFRGAADRILFDARPPDGSDLPGGNGLRFDWRLLSGVQVPLPWVLSGGLDAASVGEAIATTGATAVDVSSGVEDAPGVKSVAKIAAFVEAVRRS